MVNSMPVFLQFLCFILRYGRVGMSAGILPVQVTRHYARIKPGVIPFAVRKLAECLDFLTGKEAGAGCPAG
jgi:hypothetical protein